MLRPRFVIWAFLVGLMILDAGGVSGQDYPNKPIRVVSAESGASFVASRLIAQAISGPLGQPVIVEGRGGNQQLIMLNALPDGYSVLISGSGLWIAPLTQK